jgi:hypothetical protein
MMNRREFLTSTAMLGGGLPFSGRSLTRAGKLAQSHVLLRHRLRSARRRTGNVWGLDW